MTRRKSSPPEVPNKVIHLCEKATMTKHLWPIAEVPNKIARLPQQFDNDPQAVTVTMYGRPVMAILPFDEYQLLLTKLEVLEKTLEILQNEELLAAFNEKAAAAEGWNEQIYLVK